MEPMGSLGDGDDLSGGGLFGDRLYAAMDKRDPVAGSLLIAAPDMTDPNFQRAIVYMIEHDHSGSLGVVISRRSETAVRDILPAWAPLCAPSADFYIGGPVKPDTGIALVVARSGVDVSDRAGLQRIDGRVHVVDLDSDPDELADEVEGMRVFVGYTGWAPGQLQGELDRGDWYVAPSLPSDLLAPARVDVWGAVLRRQEMPLPLYATFVTDGDVN
jgi:putative transcriptional regulator